MRGFAVGIAMLVVVSLTVLSLRPGGLRRQLRFAARRLRIVLALGGVYLVGSTVIRIAFPQGPVADYGPPILAAVLAVAFLLIAGDPATPARESSPPSRSS